MPVSAATLQMLIDAGLEGASLVAVVASIDKDNERRSTGAARQARYMAKKKNDAKMTSANDVSALQKGFDKESFQTFKEITSENINYNTRGLISEICEVVRGITGPLEDDATVCHDTVEAALRATGLDVEREAQVRNGDGIVGRYDLVVRQGDERVAIEIDRRSARAKSCQKLLGFNGGRIQILRGSEPPHEIVGIDACLSLPVEASRCSAPNVLFDRFFAAYPVREGNRGKKRAIKDFDKATRRADPETIIAKASAFAAFLRAKGRENTEFVPMASTWLNGDGWTEDYHLSGNAGNGRVKVISDRDWSMRLSSARKRKMWSRPDWGPMPGEAGCAVPAGLIQAGDGKDWTEWKMQAA